MKLDASLHIGKELPLERIEGISGPLYAGFMDCNSRNNKILGIRAP